MGLLAQGCSTQEAQRAGEEPITRCHFADTKPQAFGQGAALGAALGAPIGLLIGLTATHERWTGVVLPGTRTARVRPLAGRRGAGLSITW